MASDLVSRRDRYGVTVTVNQFSEYLYPVAISLFEEIIHAPAAAWTVCQGDAYSGSLIMNLGDPLPT